MERSQRKPLINNIIYILKNHNFSQKYTQIQDMRYKLNKYSNNQNPYDYTFRYWSQDITQSQQGGIATQFFRRAFNQRENGGIKSSLKYGSIALLTLSTYLFFRSRRKL